MTRGFYNLTSGILSQGRRLDVVANNMTNITTPGYKTETYTDITFDEVLLSRVGNKDKSGNTVIGQGSYILAPSQLYVNYQQGSLEETGLNLDFAIQGDGFFAIQTDNGTEYTRNGSFSLDGEGYLYLPGHGRVLGMDEQPIQLMSDQIQADGNGRIFDTNGGYYGQVGVFTFPVWSQRSGGRGGRAPRSLEKCGKLQCGYDPGDEPDDERSAGAPERFSGAQAL